MTNSIDKAIRWEQVLRYQLIEIMALWEGRLISNHLTNAFGIGRQQASKVIKNYIAQCPMNLEYDQHIKGYVPTGDFSPQFTQGNADEYLHLLNSNKAISHCIEKSATPSSYTQVLSVPKRTISPTILRPIINACREKLRLEITYCSMTSPDGEERIILPHSIIFSGVRWHVRAYCEKHRDYRDFVINRIKSIDDEMGQTIVADINDTLWHQKVTIEIMPNPHLSHAQQALIARDYDMQNNVLTLTERAVLTRYTLDHLQVYSDQQTPSEHVQLVLKNRDRLSEYLS